uniref:Cyclic nucleotide-binding domain-containing protein n=1 Tax=Timema poppense TaxID=170557 RepID=A0A7R9DGP0_TIMPO|nr:unnamed protein product [Timema poppensis]
MWSSEQSSWLEIQRSLVQPPAVPDFSVKRTACGCPICSRNSAVFRKSSKPISSSRPDRTSLMKLELGRNGSLPTFSAARSSIVSLRGACRPCKLRSMVMTLSRLTSQITPDIELVWLNNNNNSNKQLLGLRSRSSILTETQRTDAVIREGSATFVDRECHVVNTTSPMAVYKKVNFQSNKLTNFVEWSEFLAKDPEVMGSVPAICGNVLAHSQQGRTKGEGGVGVPTPLLSKILPDKEERKLHPKTRFKAVVHLVMANAYWLGDVDDVPLGSNARLNVILLKKRGKREKQKLLTLQEKTILMKPASERTHDEQKQLSMIIGGLKCFRRYPEDVQKKLAAATYYRFYGPGRVVVRQGHSAEALYFILSGEVTVSITSWDGLIEKMVTSDVGTMHPGDMFGEVSLLHDIPRTATCTTASESTPWLCIA